MAGNSALPFRTKADLVYDHLRALVLSGEIAPGSRVPIGKLAKELGVSGIPVREGIKRLEAEGLLQIEAHKGAVVTEFTSDDITGLFLIRAELESLAIREAARLMDADTLAELRRILDAMHSAERAKNAEEASRLHHEFHMTIYRAQPYERLVNMIAELWTASNWAGRVYAAGRLTGGTAAEHECIYDALANGDGRKAAKLHAAQKLNNTASFVKYARHEIDSA